MVSADVAMILFLGDVWVIPLELLRGEEEEVGEMGGLAEEVERRLARRSPGEVGAERERGRTLLLPMVR